MEHLTEIPTQRISGRRVGSPRLRWRAVAPIQLRGMPDQVGHPTNRFPALAALPDETPGRDLTPSVLQVLPHRSIGRVWRLAFAIQAGMSLGFLLLLLPVITDHIAGMMVGMVGQFSIPEVKFPSPINFHVNPPVILLPHPPSLALPISITQANSPVWLTLGIAALGLFVLGNFSLVFHRTSRSQK